MQQRTLLFIKLDIEYLKSQIAEEEEFTAGIEENIAFLIADNIQTEKSEALKKRSEALIEQQKARIEKLKKQLSEAEAKEKAFMEKLHGIADAELKEMATAFFIDLQSCEEIGKRHYLERTTVYKKIQRYFEA